MILGEGTAFSDQRSQQSAELRARSSEKAARCARFPGLRFETRASQIFVVHGVWGVDGVVRVLSWFIRAAMPSP
jgi:hypothetical protein